MKTKINKLLNTAPYNDKKFHAYQESLKRIGDLGFVPSTEMLEHILAGRVVILKTIDKSRAVHYG